MALEGLGSLYKKLGRRAEAKETYRRIVDNYPKYLDRGKDPESLWRLITLYGFQRNLYDKALETCKEYLARYPEAERAGNVQFMIGEFSYFGVEYKEAIKDFNQVLTKYPDRKDLVAAAHHMMGLSLKHLGQYEEAIVHFEKVVNEYPDHRFASVAMGMIGDCYKELNQIEKALTAYQRVIDESGDERWQDYARRMIDRITKENER